MLTSFIVTKARDLCRQVLPNDWGKVAEIWSKILTGMGILGIVAVGCSASSDSDHSTLPVSNFSSTPTSQSVAKATPTALPAVLLTIRAPRPVPSSTPTTVSAIGSESTDVGISLSLNLLAPSEGAGVQVAAVRVLGVTSPVAAVTVNGTETAVATDGTFQRDLILHEGINSVSAVATGPQGNAVSKTVVVLFVPRADKGVPLSVLFPRGVEVSQPTITIIGATRQDVVLGVNGILVEVNNLGIFSTDVALEEGANLIEVVAVDLEENVNFQTVVVFYFP